MSHPFLSMDLKQLGGEPLSSDAYEGKAALVVNVASKCGLTPQYSELVELHRELVDQGGIVIGVPCNQFGAQEPGSADEIQAFCRTTYGVDFPLLEKQDVNGAERSALYRHLVESGPGGGEDIQWNFEKFVVGRDGEVVARFAPSTTPQSTEVQQALAEALGSE